MANVLNRTTLEYLLSVNTPDYPADLWVINPDLKAVAGVPSKYWKIQGDDSVVEMDKTEKGVVDTAEATAVITAKDALLAQVQATVEKTINDAQKEPAVAPLTASVEDRVRALEKAVFGI